MSSSTGAKAIELWHTDIPEGDMSIVGPRPLVDKNFELYPIHVKAAINHVKPGLTGIGSIVFRDEERLLPNRMGHFSPQKQFSLCCF